MPSTCLKTSNPDTGSAAGLCKLKHLAQAGHADAGQARPDQRAGSSPGWEQATQTLGALQGKIDPAAAPAWEQANLDRQAGNSS